MGKYGFTWICGCNVFACHGPNYNSGQCSDIVGGNKT